VDSYGSSYGPVGGGGHLNTGMNFWVLERPGNFLRSVITVSFWWRTLHCGVSECRQSSLICTVEDTFLHRM